MKGFIKLIFLPLIGLTAFTSEAEAPFQEFCGIKNTAFKAGEKVSYTIYYAVAGIYVNAGIATFTNTLETLNSKPVYIS